MWYIYIYNKAVFNYHNRDFHILSFIDRCPLSPGLIGKFCSRIWHCPLKPDVHILRCLLKQVLLYYAENELDFSDHNGQDLQYRGIFHEKV